MAGPNQIMGVEALHPLRRGFKALADQASCQDALVF